MKNSDIPYKKTVLSPPELLFSFFLSSIRTPHVVNYRRNAMNLFLQENQMVLIIIIEYFFIMWGIWITFALSLEKHDEIFESA